MVVLELTIPTVDATATGPFAVLTLSRKAAELCAAVTTGAEDPDCVFVLMLVFVDVMCVFDRVFDCYVCVWLCHFFVCMRAMMRR
jgi:hypothetical protein